jgi:hypothetical protein
MKRCEGTLMKTGRVLLGMPYEHERVCDRCGARFWTVPREFGASYAIVSGEHTPLPPPPQGDE